MKRRLAIVMVLVMVLSLMGVSNVFAELVTIEKDGTTMVQLYPVASDYGLELIWEKETKQVTFGDENNIIVLTVGSTVINVNGQEVSISKEPLLLNGRVYVPTDFIEMMFGADTMGASSSDELYEVANEILSELLKGQYQNIYENYFSEAAKNTTTADKLEEIFTGAMAEVGEYQGLLQSTDGVVESQGNRYNALQYDIAFSERGVRLVMLFDSDNLIEGMTIDYFETKQATLPEGIIEEDVIVGEGTDYPLSGKLTLPENADGPLKAIVLVHGSGPNDMDETMGSYKLFKDLAWELAQKGIAVLRYDKRTYTHGSSLTQEQIINFTVQEEVIDDALLATKLLREDNRIDSENVYLAGHSLGGKLAYRIDAEEGGDYAGIISLAGTPRSLWELTHEQLVNASQNEYIATSDDIIAQYEQIIDQMEQIGDISELTDEESKEMFFMGSSIYYFKDMDKVDDSALIKELQKPILVLQGEDDFQVFADIDYALLKELLAKNENAQFILYENVNHMFAENTGTVTNTSIDYASAIKVYASVIDDIAEFVAGK